MAGLRQPVAGDDDAAVVPALEARVFAWAVAGVDFDAHCALFDKVGKWRERVEGFLCGCGCEMSFLVAESTLKWRLTFRELVREGGREESFERACRI